MANQNLKSLFNGVAHTVILIFSGVVPPCLMPEAVEMTAERAARLTLPAGRRRRRPAPRARGIDGIDTMTSSATRHMVSTGAGTRAGDVRAAIEADLMAKVLLIEDDSETAEEITAELTDRGFEVEWSSNGVDGLDKARSLRPDAMIVDRLLPGMDGLTVIEALRKENDRTPVLVLSALGAVDDRVRGLRMGGDDYLTKPFAVVELIARIEALLRRPVESRETTLQVGPVTLDLIERTAMRGERKIDLLPREFRLLEYMMRRSDQLLTRAMLLEEVWNYKFVPATNLVDVHMGRLRHKVDGPDETPMIHNVRGAGFILRSLS
jgi:two-component system OmpR family response regulator